jgi:hypothetical protein
MNQSEKAEKEGEELMLTRASSARKTCLKNT